MVSERQSNKSMADTWLLNSSEHPGKVLLGGITSLVLGFVEKERKQVGKKLLYNRDANEWLFFFFNPNCLKGVFVKHLFKLLLLVKSIRFT